MRKTAGYVATAAIAFAAVLGYGSDLSHMASTASPGTSADSAHSWISMLPDLPTLRNGPMDWSSFGIGLVAGFILALMTQVSWFELPRRALNWLIANERNFYRLGIAGVCLAVLLFY